MFATQETNPLTRVLSGPNSMPNTTQATRPDPFHGCKQPVLDIRSHCSSAVHSASSSTWISSNHHQHVRLVRRPSASSSEKNERQMLLRKEVIQPHLPVRLPCYDFVPIASPTFDGSLPQGVRPPASGVADFRDVTGGVYKARERIHRSVADLRLLATPTSRGRVADPDPN